MTKRGVAYMAGLGILTFFILIYTIFVFFESDSNKLTARVGEIQANLLGNILDAQEKQLYSEEIVKLAMKKALTKLMENAGFYGDDCKNNEFYLWTKDCDPREKLEENYLRYLKEEKLEKFSLRIEENKLVAVSDETLFFENKREDGVVTGKYTFTVNVNEGINGIFDKLKELYSYIFTQGVIACLRNVEGDITDVEKRELISCFGEFNGNIINIGKNENFINVEYIINDRENIILIFGLELEKRELEI